MAVNISTPQKRVKVDRHENDTTRQKKKRRESVTRKNVQEHEKKEKNFRQNRNAPSS